MSAKHTPGPWGIRQSNDGSGDVGITAPGVLNVVAECFAAMRNRGEKATDEALANARLMAAAPDLLEALKIVVEHWTAQFERNGHSPPAWCAQARAALAKAEPQP